jgi:F-type H+-transporting ATPase subunit b
VLVTSQVVWLVFIFAALYLLLSRWALPQVASVIEQRSARIAADLDAAHVAKAESDAAIAEVQEATRRASTEAQAAIATAMAQAKAEATEQARQANERLDAQLAEAEQRIGVARSSAMNALRDVATETAEAVIQRLTGQQPDRTAVSAAVGAAMVGKA